jgi:hypothetical protein
MQVLFQQLKLGFVGGRSTVARPQLADGIAVGVGIVPVESRAVYQFCRRCRCWCRSRCFLRAVIAAAQQQQKGKQTAHYRLSLMPKI